MSARWAHFDPVGAIRRSPCKISMGSKAEKYSRRSELQVLARPCHGRARGAMTVLTH